MNDINIDKNNYKKFEIELSENFIRNDNNKVFPNLSLIPSNYDKIIINDVDQSNLNQPLIINEYVKTKCIYFKKLSLFFVNILTFIKEIYLQISFNWCYELIKKGRKIKLSILSFKKIPYKYSAEKLFKDIYFEWNSIYNKKKDPHILWKILLKVHLNKLLLASFFLLISSLLDFGGVIVYNELLKRFNNNEDNNIKDYDSIFNLKEISLLKLIIYYIAYTPISFILHYQSAYICQLISSISQSQLDCLIYDKVLKKATYIKNNINQGTIINLIQSNSGKFGNLILSYPEIFRLPFKIVYEQF